MMQEAEEKFGGGVTAGFPEVVLSGGTAAPVLYCWKCGKRIDDIGMAMVVFDCDLHLRANGSRWCAPVVHKGQCLGDGEYGTMELTHFLARLVANCMPADDRSPEGAANVVLRALR